jgi:hypothetical protein
MGVSRDNVCLECGKVCENGADGLRHHFRPEEGGCPAMESRGIRWTLRYDTPKNKKGRPDWEVIGKLNHRLRELENRFPNMIP